MLLVELNFEPAVFVGFSYLSFDDGCNFDIFFAVNIETCDVRTCTTVVLSVSCRF